MALVIDNAISVSSGCASVHAVEMLGFQPTDGFDGGIVDYRNGFVQHR